MEPPNDSPPRGQPESTEERKQRLEAYRVIHRRPAGVFLLIGLLILFVGLGLTIWLRVGGQSVDNQAPAVSLSQPTATNPAATPITTADPLTGQLVSPADADRPVVGIMIENLYPDARPQSGLANAGVVYEALAEGGITRFLAIFQKPLPASIGPIRSLRPYYLTWGLEYNIPVVHAGGSQPALADIKPSGLKNIDALAVGAPTFYRVSDRSAPHNLYTTGALIGNLLQRLSFAGKPAFRPLPRKPDAAEPTPSHPSIRINFSTSAYAVSYQFDAATDSYARVLAGRAHIDRNTGQQIMVKNIVVEFVPTSYSTQPDGKPETDMNLTGSGKALVFRDGGVVEGSWRKTSQKDQTQLLDGAGQPIAFNAGSTWYEIVPTGTAVTD